MKILTMMKTIAALCVATVLLSACTAYVNSGPGYWVPGHWNRWGGWVHGHWA